MSDFQISTKGIYEVFMAAPFAKGSSPHAAEK